ncbi:MAG: nuclear transport factor 2 family protein [Novosphingobium sp.]
MFRPAPFLILLAALTGCAQTPGISAVTESPAPARSEQDRAAIAQELIALSRQKWLWMASRDTARLEALFHPAARFVHMGATMDRTMELEVIRSGRIEYKRADIGELSAEVLGDTAIVYSRLRLLAVVGGNEVTNPFSVTETYVRRGGQWQLAAMAFTRLLGE